MISFLISAIKIIFLLGFLIGIHETGHFLIAKLCKVRVNEFAIGFGPVIWKKQGKETKYELRLIPLGGFVNMEGEAEQSETGRQDHKFPDRTRDKQLWRTGKQANRIIRMERYCSCRDQADRKQKCRTYPCDEARRNLPSAKAAL